MVTGYNFHIQGKRHIKQGKVCQDYSIVYDLFGSWKICAVADGVSHSEHSEVASEIACKTVCEFIEKAFPYEKRFDAALVDADIEGVIKSAMHAAANAVEAYADERGDDYSMYDTTLMVALYNGDTAYLGMIGDSGIVVLCDDGELLFSTPMKDDIGHVFPLGFRKKYKTAVLENVAAVYCATDGVFSDLFINMGERDKSRADIVIPYTLFGSDDIDEEDYFEIFRAKLIAFLTAQEGLTDDMSVALLMNTDKSLDKPERAPVNVVEAIKRMVSIYDERFRYGAFSLQIKEMYPSLSDEDTRDLYYNGYELSSVLERSKPAEDSPAPPHEWVCYDGTTDYRDDMMHCRDDEIESAEPADEGDGEILCEDDIAELYKKAGIFISSDGEDPYGDEGDGQ